MINRTDTYLQTTDENGEIYFCPIDTDISDSAVDDFDECVGKDVVGRYAGNIAVH
jgi:hypothetical protein